MSAPLTRSSGASGEPTQAEIIEQAMRLASRLANVRINHAERGRHIHGSEVLGLLEREFGGPAVTLALRIMSEEDRNFSGIEAALRRMKR